MRQSYIYPNLYESSCGPPCSEADFCSTPEEQGLLPYVACREIVQENQGIICYIFKVSDGIINIFTKMYTNIMFLVDTTPVNEWDLRILLIF